MALHLAITGLSDFWDRQKDLLLLGPWCSVGIDSEDHLKERVFRELPSPWITADDWGAAEVRCWDFQ